MNLPTTQQVKTFGLHLVSIGIGAVGVGAYFHVFSTPDAAAATAAITQISHGVSDVVAGVSTLAGIAWVAWRAVQNGPLGILLKAADVTLPSGKTPVIVTDATTAAATPSAPNIVATASQASAAQKK